MNAYSGDFRHGSVTVSGRLPEGPAGFWAHSLTDLACALRRDGGAGRFRDHKGERLDQTRIDEALRSYEAAGLRAGDVAVVEAANTLTTLAALIALWELGGVACPIDPECPQAVRDLVAEDSGATLLMSAQGAATPLERLRPEPLIRLRRPHRVTGSDLALMIFTSGSSGRPKGVALSQNNVMSALRAIVGYLGVTAEDRILAIPPLFFDYGLYQALISLMTGAELVVANEHRSVAKLAPIAAEVAPTILPVVPALASGLGRMLEISKREIPSVRLVTNTGGHLAEGAMAQLRLVLPHARMTPMYGLTESKRALYCDRALHPEAADSVGLPMPGLEAAVVVAEEDGALREAAPEEIGELWVRGTSVMQEYRGLAGASEGARLIPGRYRADNWLATGDLFKRDAEGFFFFKGRAKSLIKQGGYCLVPRDVEEMVEALELVDTAVVVGRQEENGDESAILFVRLAGEDSPEARQALRAAVKETPRSLQPREILFVAQWPSTPNGKIDRKLLTEEARRK